MLAQFNSARLAVGNSHQIIRFSGFGRHLLKRSLLLVLLVLAWFPCTALAGSLPVPFWTTEPVLSTDDGYANLSWAVGGSDSVSFYRLTEEFSGESAIHFVDHPTTRLYRIEPGSYKFRVQACERTAEGYPNCGSMSPLLTLTVSQVVASRQTGKSGKRNPPPGPVRSPSGFTPGRWHNPDREGHGWSFFWKSRLALPEGAPLYGDAWDLVGLWYTYEARVKYAQNPGNCPGPSCVWVYEEYRPVYADLRLTKISSQRYHGTVYITRNGVEDNVGAITVDFGSDSASASLSWGANFDLQYFSGNDDIELLVAPDSDPVDNPAHYSGLWESPFGQNYVVAHGLGYTSESVEVVFEDEDGQPAWIMTDSDDPIPGHTNLCFYYVAEGFPPGTTDSFEFYESGCDPDLPASGSNRNGFRRFTDFEEEAFWVNVSLPGGTAPNGFVAGTSSFPHPLTKSASFHRVDFDSSTGPSCTLSTNSPQCTVDLTWFTDGNYPETTVFAFESNGGERAVVETAMVSEDYEWCIDEPGEWQFELRMGDTADSSLMGISDTFEVTGQPTTACGGAGPETPPPPAPAPNMTPTAASSRTGATPGSFSVSPTGGASYQIPILTAPGSGGLSPSIALSYSSQAENGPVGVGWGIDGFSVISRCAQTIESDGTPSTLRVSFTAEDRFCLDGERLMAVSGVYGNHGTEYRKEVDDYTRVISYGSGSDGPDYFKVWTRDGVLYEFGRTSDSYIESRASGIETVAYAWAQNRVEDTAGNYMEYEYSERAQGPVDFVLKEIRYTGNASAGTQPYAEIRFAYSNGRNDAQTSYMAGVASEHSRRLDYVDSLSRVNPGTSQQYLRRYVLDYGVDGWGRASLESVTECRDASESVCFEPTEFTWQKSEHKVLWNGPDVSDLFTADFRGLALGDISGDGRADLLITERDGNDFEFGVATGNADGHFFMPPQRYDLPAGFNEDEPVALTVIDLNADGYQDVIYVRWTAGQVNWHARLAGPNGMGEEFTILANCCNLLSPTLLQVMDFNGDGLSDVMTHRPVVTFEGASEIIVLINEFEPGDAFPSFGEPIAIDVNYPDLFPSNTPTGWELADEVPSFGFQTGRPMPGQVDDFYGDGTADMLVRLSRLYRRCAFPPCPPNGADGQDPPEPPVFLVGGGGAATRTPGGPGIPDPAEDAGTVTFYLAFFADEDGQYSTYEIVARGAGQDCSVPDICNPYYELPQVKRMQPVDINADGLADVAYLDEDDDWYYRLNNGATFLDPELIGQPPNDERAELARLIDINGDRYPELLYPDTLEVENAAWMVQYNDLGQGFSAPQGAGIPAGNILLGDLSVFLDFTADGIIDQLFVDWRVDGNGAEDDTTRLHRGINLVTLQPGEATNAITAIEDGFGARTEVDYLPLTDPVAHTRLNSAANADWGRGSVVYDLSVPFYVVSSVETSAPVYGNSNATNVRAYHYAGAKLQAGGRGFLGFAETVEWDPQTQLRTNTRYRQDFPFVGLIADSGLFLNYGVYQPDLISDISDITPVVWPKVNASTSLPGPAPQGALMRYSIREWKAVENGPETGAWAVQSPAELNREYSLSGQFIRKTLTTRTFDDFGNILLGEERVFDSDTTNVWSRETTDNYWMNDEIRWRLGRLTGTEVTHGRSGAGMQIVRESSYSYHPQNSLLVRETAEPGNPTRQIVTEYVLDLFGNHVGTELTGIGMPTRESVSVFDPLGRFAVEARNAYGQVTKSVEQWDVFGNPLHTENIDGVGIIAASDGMGRPFVSYSETGSWSRTDMAAGSHSRCPGGTAYHAIRSGGGAATQVSCFDRIRRESRTATEGFLGGWIQVDHYFDASGRPERVSEPYYSGGNRYWNFTQYDGLGRITQTTAANGLVESIFYDGAASHCGHSGARAVVTRTNSGGGTIRDHWEQKNVAGETEVVLDENCGALSFGYDAVGNLVETVGVDGSVITIDYDALGLHKVGMTDPDKGHWQYASNALGEVTRQLDSKQQAIDFVYDRLGRVTHRRELTGVSSLNDNSYQTANHEIRHWQNSTTPGVVGRGQVSVEEYRAGESGAVLHQRIYSHDDFGRVTRVDHSLENETFVETTTYDQFGRVFQKFDASGDSRGVRFHYNARGYVAKLQEARDGPNGVVYQEVLSMDPRGNPTALVLGNQSELFAEYDPASGYISRLEAYDANGSEMQFVDYQFDTLGNLEWRRDRSGSNDLREDFEYDDLDRLERVLLTAPQLGFSQFETQALSYSPSGNINFKSDVGSYTYGQGSAGPHAVTRAGNVNYFYDANGNQVSSSDGRSIDYRVFDKAERIQKGLSFTEFSYGLGNMRYKRTDDNVVDQQKTTWTIGSVELIEEAGASDRFKRYIGGVAIADFYPSSGQSDTWYLAKDHLGSIHSISNSNGVKVQENHFDPWGVRRESDWQSPLQTAAASAANGFTTRGFTGHEHADGLGIIQMNGRIYDPRLGRFLQADPFVQAPRNGQALNRYSYVLNNPLSYTDPSGYFYKRFIRRWGRVIVAAVAAYFTWGASYGAAASGIAAGAGNSAAFAQFVGAVGWQGLAGSIAGAASGFVAGAIVSGSLRGAVKSAFAGGITGGIASHFGDTYSVSRIFADSFAGGVTSEIYGDSFKDGFLMAALTSIATYANVRMRQYQAAKSSVFPGQVGISDGFRGVSGKYAGERINEHIWNQSGAAKAYAEGKSLEEVLEIYQVAREEIGKLSPLGCLQGGPGCVFGKEYKPNGIVDYVLEGYAGVHDTLNQPFFYQPNGTLKQITNPFMKRLGSVINITNVVVASPIVIPSLIPDYMRHLVLAAEAQ